MKCIHSHATLTMFAAAIALIATGAVNAAEPLRVGTMTVQQHGNHGQALVLIPGLASGGWVWDDVVETLKKDHLLYVVTLAGFDGTAPEKGKLIDRAGESLLELIRTQHLDKPVLIGHSLGGTLAIRFAQEHSDLISAVVAVDGLPIFPGFENLPAAQRVLMGESMRAQMARATPEQFAAQQLGFMKSMGVIAQAKATELAARTSRSDPEATAQYMAEVVALDLRPGLPSITVPVLEICPYYADDYPKTRPRTEKEKTEYYRGLMKGTPKLEVVSIAPSRHFVMFDQPAAFSEALGKFLKSLPAKATTSPAAPGGS